jgi:hypothetical protein
VSERGDLQTDEPDGKSDPQRSAIKPPAVWSIFVGVVFCAVIVVAVANSVSGSDGGVLGSGDDAGLVLPDFAVADALGDLTGDANIDQTDCASSQRPCPADSRRTPACEVSVDGAIRSCDVFRRPAVVSFWFTRGGECEDQQDVFETAYRRFSARANFLAIDVRDDRATVRNLIRDRGWTHPVGLDPDGALSNLLRVGGCPTVLFVEPGGRLYEVALGNQTPSSLASRVEDLIRASADSEAGGAGG